MLGREFVAFVEFARRQIDLRRDVLVDVPPALLAERDGSAERLLRQAALMQGDLVAARARVPLLLR